MGDRGVKVAHVTATFPPYWAGTGNVAFHNARLLQARGHAVTVFTADAAPAAASARAPAGAAPATAAAAEFDAPFPVERLPARFRVGNAPLTPGLYQRLAGFGLIHLHHPYIFGAELAMLAARRYRVPLVVTYHNRLQDDRLPKRLLFAAYERTSEPLLLRQAARILAVRQDHLFSLFPHLRGTGRVTEVRNGVDTALFRRRPPGDLRARLGIPPAAPTALFVGSLDQAHRFKNVEGLLRAFAGGAPERHLIVVGEGDRRGALTALAESLGLAGRAHFLGDRRPEALPDIYGAADVTVLPSTAVESFGLVLVESLACETPVIASALPGVRDVVAHGVDGYLVPPGDEPALGRALDLMLDDRCAARAMGRRGRAKACAEYDWELIGDRLAQVYREVLAT